MRNAGRPSLEASAARPVTGVHTASLTSDRTRGPCYHRRGRVYAVEPAGEPLDRDGPDENRRPEDDPCVGYDRSVNSG